MVFPDDVTVFVALYSLNLEKCSVTSRTVQTIADSLQSDSSLSHLALGIYFMDYIFL